MRNSTSASRSCGRDPLRVVLGHPADGVTRRRLRVRQHDRLHHVVARLAVQAEREVGADRRARVRGLERVAGPAALLDPHREPVVGLRPRRRSAGAGRDPRSLRRRRRRSSSPPPRRRGHRRRGWWLSRRLRLVMAVAPAGPRRAGPRPRAAARCLRSRASPGSGRRRRRSSPVRRRARRRGRRSARPGYVCGWPVMKPSLTS